MDDADSRPNNSPPQDSVLEFRNLRKVGLYVTIALGAATFALALVVVTVFLALLSQKPNGFMPAMATLQSMIVFVGVSSAIYLLRMPVRVILEPQQLTLEWLIRRRSLPWDNVAEIQLKKSDFPQTWLASFARRKDLPQEHLLILDGSGRKIAQIGPTMDRFSLLVQEIHRRSSHARHASTFDLDRHSARIKTAQKSQRRFMLVLGFLFTAVGMAAAVVTFVTARNEYLLDKQGRIAQAGITRRYIYNITPRIEYKFTAADGSSYSKDVMVERRYYDTLEENGPVPIKYLPVNPESSRLLSGQVDSTDLPLPLVVLSSAFMTCMGLLCLAMYFLGISDIKFQNGRFRLVRAGRIEPPALPQVLLEDTEQLYVAQDLTAPDLQTHLVEHVESLPLDTSLTSRPRRLPPGLKAVGILNIVFGALGTLWNAGRMAVALLFVNNAIAIPGDMEITADIQQALLAHAFAVVAALLLVVSGIAILAFRKWGRILATIAASGKLLHGSVEAVMACLITFETADPQQQFTFNVTRALLLFWIMLTMVYPIVVIVLLNRKSTRLAFRTA